ncbi:phBC6A51 family helix-turn-helix protein [Bacteroides sp.]|uniref:phBC6A51 family helix-turn-helix protein n=1 Tax=Bacteroides sp. TaxID=29523 RepID=UPI002FC8C330
MAKYSKILVDKICSLIRGDSYTIAEICAQVGISEAIYFKWKKEKVEFFESIKKAEEARLHFMVTEAKKSLLRKIQGYEVEETKTVYLKPGKDDAVDDSGKKKLKVKEQTVTKKHVQPDTAAIIFTLTNGDPDNWKNRQNSDVNAKVEASVDIKPMTRKEALKIMKENGIG